MRLLCDISVRQKIHGIDVANTWSHLVLTAIKNCQYDDDIDKSMGSPTVLRPFLMGLT